MKNRFMKVNEVAEELEVSIPYAYKIIRKLNEELESKGYLTVKGRINRDEAFEKEFTLPEPQRMESAKSYKNRIEGMFNKLKAFVKNVFIDLMKARSLNAELYSKNTSLGFTNIDLQNSNRHYQKENLKLRKQLTDYRLLRKVLGKQQVDQILEAAKHPNKKERNHNHEQNFIR